MDTNTAMTVVLSVGGFEAMKLVMGYFFKRVTRDDYITKSACNECSKGDAETIKHLTDEIHTVKGILLVVAVNSGVPPEQIAKLTR